MTTPSYEALLEAVQNLAAELAAMRNAKEPVNPLTEVDERGLLVYARQVGNAIVDPVVPEGTPTTVKMPVTGHVLSVARPDLGEMFMGYCQRVSDQAEGNINTVGALMIGTAKLFKATGGFNPDGSNWPEAADRFYNMRAYMTDAERAADDEAKEGWKRVHDRMRNREGGQGSGGQQTPNTPPATTPPSGNVPADEQQL